MKNFILRSALLAIIAVMLSACGEDKQLQLLDQSREAAANGKYSEAVELCNKLMASPDTTKLTAGDYCHLAIIYALAADNDIDQGGNMAVAAKYLDHANDMSADSVKVFFRNLPPEKMSVIKQLEQLNLTRGIDFTNFEDPEYGEYENDSLNTEEPHEH